MCRDNPSKRHLPSPSQIFARIVSRHAPSPSSPRSVSPLLSPRISISREPKRCIFVLCESLSLSIREPNQLFSDLCESLRVFISASVRGKAALVLALRDFKPKAALARTGALNITHPMQHDSVFCANNITWVLGTSQRRRRVHHYDTDEYMN